jgi:hypothetical protein
LIELNRSLRGLRFSEENRGGCARYKKYKFFWIPLRKRWISN